MFNIKKLQLKLADDARVDKTRVFSHAQSKLDHTQVERDRLRAKGQITETQLRTLHRELASESEFWEGVGDSFIPWQKDAADVVVKLEKKQLEYEANLFEIDQVKAGRSSIIAEMRSASKQDQRTKQLLDDLDKARTRTLKTTLDRRSL